MPNLRTLDRRRSSMAGALGLSLLGLLGHSLGCVPEPALVEVETPEELGDSDSDAPMYLEASEQTGVPADLIAAWAYVETRLESVRGEVELEGMEPPYGPLALRGRDLELAAGYAGLSAEQIRAEPELGLRAGAALLAALADEVGIPEEARSNPFAWEPALRRYLSFEPELEDQYVVSIMNLLRKGLIVPRPNGRSLVIGRYRVEGQAVEQQADGLGAAGVVMRSSPNHSSRGQERPVMVIIHTCEGAYAGCVSWLRNSGSSVSAHYVVSEDGSEVSQLVDESRKAWHIGARYRSALNGGAMREHENKPGNSITIGIEHAGFGRQSFWPQGQISRSVALVRDVIARWNIDPDRVHIVGHGQLQPENRTDPGAGWPWASYLQDIGQGALPPPPAEPEPTTPPPSSTTPQSLVVDNGTAGRFRASSRWLSSEWAAGRVGADYRARRPAFESDLAEFRVPVSAAGRYEVFVRAPGNGYHPSTPIVVRHAAGETIARVDLSHAGGSWVSAGTYTFAPRDDWIIGVSCWTSGNAYVIADAVRFEPRP